jgi:hypothetical protein
VAYIIIIALYTLAGTPPVGGEAWLSYLAGKPTLWWAIIGISLLTNFCYLPVALSLYTSRRLYRVSAFFALITQRIAAWRYDGGRAVKKAASSDHPTGYEP